MEAALTPQSPKPSTTKIDLPGLDLNVAELKLPDVVKTKTVVESALKGANTTEKVAEIPFSAELRVQTSSCKTALEDIGITRMPNKAFSIHLSLQKEDGVPRLKMNYTSAYTTTEQQQRSREVNVRYHPTGQHTPYGPKDSPGYWDTETEYYTEKVNVERTERASNKQVEGEAFNQLYLGVLNSTGGEKDGLLRFLHKNFPELSRQAQTWISKCLNDRVAEAKAKLEQEADVFKNLHLPAIEETHGRRSRKH